MAMWMFGGSVLAWYAFSTRTRHANRRGIGSPHPSTRLKEYKNCVYLDYNATTPIWPEVSEAMASYTLTSFGNPSSAHIYAIPCRNALHRARDDISSLINCENSSIIMTSCGSESDNRAIDIAIAHYHQGCTDSNSLPHIIASCIEHPAIIEYLKFLANTYRIEYTLLDVNEDGYVSAEDVVKALKESTALVTIMHSNNEIGTLQPIQEISKRIQEYNQTVRESCSGRSSVLFHSDAAQSLGKVVVDVQRLGVDMLTMVGHKYGAPKGIAALYVKPGIQVQPLLFGGGQECGRRAGTENVLLTVAMGEASHIASAEFPNLVVHLLRLRLLLISLLNDTFKALVYKYNGPSKAYDLSEISAILLRIQRAPPQFFPLVSQANSTTLGVLLNTVSVSFRDVTVSKDIIPRLSQKLACSAGAACHSHGTHSVSSVLKAIKIPEAYQYGTLRLSFGRHTTQEEIIQAVRDLDQALARVRPQQH